MFSINPLPHQNLGLTENLFTVSGKPIKTQFAVVELNSLITSNHVNGAINELYPQELQPKDRTTKKSQKQVSRLANELNLHKLSFSKTTVDGAPILGTDNYVESGNGRVIAIKKAYFDHHADVYRKSLENGAENFGIDTETVKAMRFPVLVRYRLTDVDRSEFVKDCNTDKPNAKQAKKTVGNIMLESVGKPINDLISQVQSAKSIDEITLIIESNFINLADLQFNDFSTYITKRLKSFADKFDIKSFYREYLTLKEKAEDVGKLDDFLTAVYDKKQEIFSDDKASDEWYSLCADPEIEMFVLGIYNCITRYNSDDYISAKTGYNWLIKNKTSINYITFDFANWYLQKVKVKLSQKEWSTLKDLKPIVVINYAKNPLSNLVSKHQELIKSFDAPRAKKTTKKMREDQISLLTIGFDGAFPYMNLIDESLTGIEKDLHIAALSVHSSEYLNNSNLQKKYGDKIFSSQEGSEEKAQAKQVYDFIESNQKSLKNQLNDKDYMLNMVEKNKGMLLNYIENGVIPNAAYVGLKIHRRLTDFEASETKNATSKKVKSWMKEIAKKNPTIKEIRTTSDLNAGLRVNRIKWGTFSKYVGSFHQLVNGAESNVKPPLFTYKKDEPRASCTIINDGTPYINIGKKFNQTTAWHELGHAIEGSHQFIKDAALTFLQSRYNDAPIEQKVVNLRYLNGMNYLNDEYCVNNYVSNPYSMRFYKKSSDKDMSNVDGVVATEVVSIGMQWLHEDINLLAMAKDHFDLMIAIIAELNEKKGE